MSKAVRRARRDCSLTLESTAASLKNLFYLLRENLSVAQHKFPRTTIDRRRSQSAINYSQSCQIEQRGKKQDNVETI